MADHHHNSNSTGGFFSSIFRSLVHRRNDSENHEQNTNDVEMSSNNDNVGAHDATTRIPTVTVDDDDNEMPPLQDVSDSEDEGEDDMYLNVASIPPSSEVSNAPSPMAQGSSSVPSPLPEPRRAGQRRARVDDDDDQERDRRHPSQRVNDNSSSNNPSVNDNNNAQPRRHPSISVSIDLGPGPPGPIPIPINAGIPFPGHHHHHNHDHEGEDNAGRPLHGMSFMEFMNRRFPMPPQPPPANPNSQPAEGPQPHRHMHPPFPGPGGIVVPLPVAALPGLFRALSSSLNPSDANVPPPGPDIFTLFGGLGGLTEEREDTAKGQQVVDGLEVVPPGLVKRLARVNKELGEGEDGMDGAGCAICWEKLIPDDAEDVIEKQAEGSTSSDDAQAAPTTDENSSESAKPLQTTPDVNANKIVSLPCTHTFHAACLVPWFSRPRQTTCPVCRFDLDPEGLVWGMSRSRRMGGMGGGGIFGMNDFMRMFGGPPTAAGPNPEPTAAEAGNDAQGAATPAEGQGEGTGQPGQRDGPTSQVVRDLLELGRVLGLGREGPIPTQPTPAREGDAPGTAQATPDTNTAAQATQATNVSDPPAHGAQATPAPSTAEAQPEAANTGSGTGDQSGDDQLRETVHRFVSGLFGGVGGANQPNIRVMNTGRTGGPIQVIIDMPPRRQGGEEPAAPAPAPGAVPTTPATTGDNVDNTNNTTQQTQTQGTPTGAPNGANPPQRPLGGPVFSIGFDMIIGGPPPPGLAGDGFGFGIPIPLPRNPPANQNNSNNNQPPANDDDDLDDLPLADVFDMFLGGGPPLHEDRTVQNAGHFLDLLRRDMERQPNNNQRNARSQSPPSDIDSDGDVIMVEPIGFDDDDEEFELSLAREERRVQEARQASSAQQNVNTTESSSFRQPSSSPQSSSQEHQRPHVHRHSIPGGYVSMVTGTADSMDDAMRQIMDAVGGPPPPYAMPRRPPPTVSDPPRGVRERRGMSIPIPVPQFMRASTTSRPLNNNDRRPSAQVPSFLSSLGSGSSSSLPSSAAAQRDTQEHSRQRSGESRERRRLSGVHVPNVFAPWMNLGSSRRTSLPSSSASSSTARPTHSSSFPSSNSSPQPPTPRQAGPPSSDSPQTQAQSSSGARPRPRHRPYSPPPFVDLDDDAPMSFSQFLRTTAVPRAPPPRRRTRPAPPSPQRPAPKKWSAPLPPGLTLRERIEKKEREAGLRCADPSCGIGPSDDEPFLEGQRKQIRIRAKKSIKGKEKEEERGAEYVCDHAFHPSCLVSAHRVAMSMYARDEEGEAVGDEVDVECSICRHEGVVSRSEWEEGVKG